MVLDMEANDVITNEYEPGGFVRNQVTRFGNLVGATLLPIIESIDLSELENILKNKLSNLN